MLIGDPLGEGSNASSTNSELWRAEKSYFRMRAQTLGLYLSFIAQAARRVIYYRALGSGETQTLRREWHAHR